MAFERSAGLLVCETANLEALRGWRIDRLCRCTCLGARSRDERSHPDAAAGKSVLGQLRRMQTAMPYFTAYAPYPCAAAAPGPPPQDEVRRIGFSPAAASRLFQLFAAQTLPAGSMDTSVIIWMLPLWKIRPVIPGRQRVCGACVSGECAKHPQGEN